MKSKAFLTKSASSGVVRKKYLKWRCVSVGDED